MLKTGMRIILISICLMQVGFAKMKTFYLVVHPSNETANLKEVEAKNIILKKIKRWDNGDKIKVFLPNGKSFSSLLNNFLGMDSFKWEEYWGEQTLKSGQKPPKVIKNELTIVRNISKNKKAFGVLSGEKFNEKMKKLVKVVLKLEL